MLKLLKIALIVFFVHPVLFGQNSVDDDVFAESPIHLSTGSGVIGGTLTKPNQDQSFPVALIIAGSGPTDRNGNNALIKNGNLQKLAYALARLNIASVRYDKRGIGESARAAKQEQDLHFEDYVTDAAEWVALLKKDERFSKVVIIGHSEGALIGMLAATGADAFISLEGAGKSADKLLKEQLKNQPSGIQDISFPIIDSLAHGITVATVDPLLHSLFRPSVQPYLISWFRYDPAVELKKLKIPVLIIQGTQDIQVSEADARLLAASHPSAKLVIVNNMNHIFRIINGDRKENMASYNNDAAPVAMEMVKSISDFIQNDVVPMHEQIKP